jgi:hypothetical protein
VPDAPDREPRPGEPPPDENPDTGRAHRASDDAFDEALDGVLEEHADALRRLTT